MDSAISKDKALKQAVEDYPIARLISESLIEDEVRGVLGENLGGNQEAGMHSTVVIRKTEVESKNTFIWKWLIAACIVGIIGWTGFELMESKNDNVLFADLVVPTIWDSRSSDDTNLIQNAINEYQSGNTDFAKSKLRNYNTNQANYWLGEIYFNEEKYDSVLIQIPTISEAFEKRDKINYLKIISLYALGEQDEMYQVIENLPPDTDQYYLNRYKLIR